MPAKSASYTVGLKTLLRVVWRRHNLLTRNERLFRLERTVLERNLELSDAQVRLLERFSPEFRDRHIEVECTDSLVAADTFLVATLKGVDRVYLQSIIDCHSRYAWGRLYTSKLPVAAVHVLNEDVLPLFRGASRQDRNDPFGQWSGILRSRGAASL